MNNDAMEVINNTSGREEHPFWIWESIMATPAILEECLQDKVLQQVRKVADQIRDRKIERIYLLGTGSSYFATLTERFAFESICGIPTSCFLTTEFMQYPQLELNEHSAVFFHSHSGGTKGDPQVVQSVKDSGGYTVGITDVEGSALAKCVDDTIIGPGGGKIELPATRTYSSAIFRMIQLAIELGSGTHYEEKARHFSDQLARIPGLLKILANNYAEKASQDVDALADCRSFFVIGSGPNYATADEAALGISQSTDAAAQSFQLENFVHGPIQTLRNETGVVFIAASGPFQERLLVTAQACKVIGAKVALLKPEGTVLPCEFDVEINIPDDIPELLSPLLYMTPLWQLAYHFSLRGKGCHTDRLAMDKPEFKEAFALIMSGDKKFVK